MNARRFFIAARAPGHKIPPPPASAVRLTGSALVLAGVTSVLDTAPRKAHNAAECDYCLTGERHPAQMF